MLVDPKAGIGYAFGEKLPSAHVNTVWNQQPDAIDGIAGGTYAGTNVLTLSGAFAMEISRTLALTGNVDLDGCSAEVVNGGTVTWMGTSALPSIGSREYIVSQPLIAMPTGNLWLATPPKWGYLETAGVWNYSDADAGTAYMIAFPLTRLINRATLAKVAVVIHGAGPGGSNHGGTLPGTLPKATLYKRVPTSGVTTPGSEVTDAPSNATNYDTEHCLGSAWPSTWTWTGLTEVITYNAQYWVVVKGETGANVVDNALAVTHIECSFTCTEVAPG